MRTIDPELWSKKVKGRKLELSQPLRFRPGEAALKARIRGYSYSDAMGEFRRNCSVAAFRNLESQDTRKCERYYWRILLAIFILGAFLVMIFSVVRFMMIQSLQISHTSSQYSLQRMHFPAVALCSYNIISNHGLDILTKELKERDEYRRYSHEDLRNGLLQFGRLQTMALLSPALPIQEQQVGPSLRRLTSRYGFPDYNVSLLMLQLAPSCDSMLVKCAWRGKEMPCDYLFAMRVTSVGYCCVFNSRYEPYDMENPPRVLDREGKDNGLSVIYREDIDDFGLVRRPVHGIEVLIFDGMEYPLLEGGGVRVQRTQPNAVVFFKLRTRTQLASSSLSIFPEFLRGCRMKSGSSQPSYSWCLMECRRRAIEDLCGCVPYTLQPRQDLVCSLDHLLCLNKHREKFLNRFPSTSSQLHLPEESVNALFCPDCQPDCARTTHTVVSNRVPFNHLRKMLRDSFTHGIKDIANISLLRFFYPTIEQDLYTLEPDEVWFERIASLSSQWVGVLGLTMVTWCELVFHCTVRWRHHYTRRMTLH